MSGTGIDTDRTQVNNTDLVFLTCSERKEIEPSHIVMIVVDKSSGHT